MMLFANGCSMTRGEELGGEELNKDGFSDGDLDTAYRLKNAWPNRLSDKLNIEECVNVAYPGSSNDKIFRTTIEWTIEYLKTNDPKNLFVIIGWSAPSRIEFRINNRWQDILPQWAPPKECLKHITVFYRDNIYDDTFDYTRTILNIISLQSWLKSNSIPYLFTSSLPVKFHNIDANMVSAVDTNRYFGTERHGDFYMSINDKDFPRGPRNHPLEEGHEYWAEIVYKHIDKNRWLLKQ